MSTVKTSLSSGRKRKRGNFAHSLLGRQIEGGHGRKKREALRPVGVPGRLRVKLQVVIDISMTWLVFGMGRGRYGRGPE
eukprot:1366948-Amorphochlora_amoeboformis.AAC.1